MAGKLTKAGDVYAFGVLVWGMCMGKLPWAGLRPVQIIMQARHTPRKQHLCLGLKADSWSGATCLRWSQAGTKSRLRPCMAASPSNEWSMSSLSPSFTCTQVTMLRKALQVPEDIPEDLKVRTT